MKNYTYEKIKTVISEYEELRVLLNTTSLIGQLNTLIAKIKKPYLFTYIIEQINAIASNSIENIHTTMDIESTNMIIKGKNNQSPYIRYCTATRDAHKRLELTKIIRNKDIELMNSNIRGINSVFRTTPVSIRGNNNEVLHNGIDAQEIPSQMANLIKTINEDSDKNPIIRALVIHHQFEYIHPFTDGNGRTGRLLFSLLLKKFKVLDIPASVFSYSILKNRSLYYHALKKADEGDLHFYKIKMLNILNDSLKLSFLFVTKISEEKQKILNYEDVKNSPRCQSVVE
jgi:Fic family protein